MQERVGLMGRCFKVIKLRSMYQDAESRTGAVWAKKNDPRITPIDGLCVRQGSMNYHNFGMY